MSHEHDGVNGSLGIVGGGGAGLVTAHAALNEGIEPLVYEARDGIGGNWRYDPEPGRSSCYASLITNTSRRRTSLRSHSLRGFGRGTHARHDEMLAYLEDFARQFDLNRRTMLRTEVVSARPVEGGWRVETAAGEVREHRALVVATGYNSVPSIPEWDGALDGPIVHTHDYREPSPYEGLDVVVVGMGCSATELACEISEVARSVTLLARSPRDVLPHKLGPLPVDATDNALNSRIPWALRRTLVGTMGRLAVGNVGRYGLPRNEARPGSLPIAVSGALRSALRSGRVKGATGTIARLAGDRVILEDGRELAADAILAGTGYRTEFPFLPPEADPPALSDAPLYRGIVSLALPSLFYVGVVAGHGGLLPMFEAQAAWVAAVLSGRVSLPDRETMAASVAADAAVRRRDFDPRIGIMFDRMRYVRAVRREAKRGMGAGAGAAPTYA